MLIAIDGNEANVEKKVGVSVYTFELLSFFQKKASKEIQFIVYLRNKPRTDLPKPTDYFNYRVVWGPFLWSKLFLPLRLILDHDFDTFFSPAHYVPAFCPSPTVVTIHDLSYLYYPDEFLKKDLYKLKSWTEQAIEKSKAVIAVSNYTKADIVKHYPKQREKIVAVHNGFRNLTPTREAQTLPPRYLLYVGTVQPRKNIEALFTAFAKLKKKHDSVKLVITGKKGWMYSNIFDRVRHLHLEKEVIFTGYVLDGELAQIYSKAQALVIPSLYEGFGIPVLEAMSLGCPVLASNSSALPEIAGEAALYFDPRDTIDMSKKMDEVLSNKQLRQDLAKKGLERVKSFSWTACGRQTLEILQESVHENEPH